MLPVLPPPPPAAPASCPKRARHCPPHAHLTPPTPPQAPLPPPSLPCRGPHPPARPPCRLARLAGGWWAPPRCRRCCRCQTPLPSPGALHMGLATPCHDATVPHNATQCHAAGQEDRLAPLLVRAGGGLRQAALGGWEGGCFPGLPAGWLVHAAHGLQRRMHCPPGCPPHPTAPHRPPHHTAPHHATPFASTLLPPPPTPRAHVQPLPVGLGPWHGGGGRAGQEAAGGGRAFAACGPIPGCATVLAS